MATRRFVSEFDGAARKRGWRLTAAEAERARKEKRKKARKMGQHKDTFAHWTFKMKLAGGNGVDRCVIVAI